MRRILLILTALTAPFCTAQQPLQLQEHTTKLGAPILAAVQKGARVFVRAYATECGATVRMQGPQTLPLSKAALIPIKITKCGPATVLADPSEPASHPLRPLRTAVEQAEAKINPRTTVQSIDPE